MTRRFVAHYRVSTGFRGGSGLGQEAQRAAVKAHVAGSPGVVDAEFVEVESGRRRDCPQLAGGSPPPPPAPTAPCCSLAAAKACGFRLGNPNLGPDTAEQAGRADAATPQQLTDALTARSVATPSRREARWHPIRVAYVERRARSRP